MRHARGVWSVHRAGNGDRNMTFTCAECGLHLSTAPTVWPLFCRCGTRYDHAADPGQRPPTGPGVAKRAANYAGALARWIAGGRPVRAPGDVEKLRLICAGCRWYNGERKTCTHARCGCAVGGAGALGDKLRWATEHCPVGEW